MPTGFYNRATSAPRPRIPIEVLFWAKVNKDGPVIRPELGPCWIWTACRRNGYGAIKVGPGSKMENAHRLSWIMANGVIPEGKLICHKCDNKICVHPDHLYAGSSKDNSQDILKRNRHKLAKLTPEIVREIRSLYRFGNGLELAAKFGIDGSVVSRIVNRKVWSHVD